MIIKYHLILLLITPMIFWSCGPNNEEIVHEMAQFNYVTSEYIGFAGEKSNQYSLYQIMSKRFSSDDLKKLISHDSLSVVIYAAKSLINRDLIAPSKLFKDFLEDNRTVYTINGCNIGKSTVAEEIYFQKRNSISADERIFNKDLIFMDSLIIFSLKKNQLLFHAAINNRIHPKTYISTITKRANENDYIEAHKYLINQKVKSNILSRIESLKTIREDKRNYQSIRDEANKLIQILKEETSDNIM